jgi:hypothetical protein
MSHRNEWYTRLCTCIYTYKFSPQHGQYHVAELSSSGNAFEVPKCHVDLEADHYIQGNA